MKKASITFAVLLGAYVLLFFLWAPINMLGLKYDQLWLVNLTYRYDDIANNSWASKLGQDNPIMKIRTSNTHFWCNQFDKCVIKSNTP